VLDDDGFVLTESSAILKYLALEHDLPVYPGALAEQIRVDEMVSWFTTNFRGYHCIFGTYPHMIPALSALSPVTRAEMAALGAHGSKRYLTVLDRQLADGGPYVCGKAITIADYVGISQVTLADFVDFDFSPYPNVEAWIALMRQQSGWDAAFAGFTGLVQAARKERKTATA
jgi:glutathione S-transferase